MKSRGNNDKLGKIIAPNRRYSSLIRKFSANIVNIQLIRGKLEFKNRLKRDG